VSGRAPATHALGLLAAGALLAGCASAPLRPGEALVRRRCGACHAVPTPEPARGDQRMAALARHKISLTPAEVREIELYLRGGVPGTGGGESR